MKGQKAVLWKKLYLPLHLQHCSTGNNKKDSAATQTNKQNPKATFTVLWIPSNVQFLHSAGVAITDQEYLHAEMELLTQGEQTGAARRREPVLSRGASGTKPQAQPRPWSFRAPCHLAASPTELKVLHTRSTMAAHWPFQKVSHG